ncbi:F-box only protein 28 isoform X1 [Lynx canadensis]|uniref:F-box only protein 28 isoform X1 n=1 Tax=Lynx canadensis TaxID=61383 RepID=UPI0011B01945|nr:F-box only protein 28 isoform X1 [Lynx canadensis]
MRCARQLPVDRPRSHLQLPLGHDRAVGGRPDFSKESGRILIQTDGRCSFSPTRAAGRRILPLESAVSKLVVPEFPEHGTLEVPVESPAFPRVCKRMDLVCQRMLNQGFLKVERYHNLCQKQVKAQLPRRESERRNHSLARHADILAAVETRLSLLNMTFMKYVDSNLCCFIPGKVIDEIYRVLRYVNSTRAPQRAHEVLQELRDISSMAMEYFDEKIVPILKRKLPGSDVSGRLMGSPPVPGPSAALTTMQLFSKQNPSRQEVTKLQQQVKTNGAGVTVLRREVSELRTKVQEQQKQLQDQDQKLLEQTQIIGEQSARLAELEHKLREVMESAVGDAAASGHGEEAPRKRKKAAEATDSLRKSKRLRNRK